MKLALLFLGLFFLITGCKVGPNYHPPLTPMPPVYIEDRPDQTTPVDDEDLVQWWTLLDDPFLNLLLEETICTNFDYRIALEQVYQARAQYWMQFTQLLPELEFDAQASRSRTSQSFASAIPTPLSPYQNFYQIGFDAIWEIDVFGRLRRSAEAAYDTWEAYDESARNVKITVLSEVARIYITICSYQAKKDISTQIVLLDEELLELSNERLQAGLASELQVESARATLAADIAALKVIEIALKQNIYSLAVLLGKPPADVVGDFEIERPIPFSRERVPAGIPGDLLRRRPDIRSAERQLAAATEQIGVAVAELFPTFSLIGSSRSFAANPLQGANIGYSSDRFSKLFNASSKIWGIGTLVTWPVFDFGQRVANVSLQRFLRNQAYLTYQKTVITALQEVEQALAAYFKEEERELSLTNAAEANKRSFELTADLFQSGLADYSQVLQAKEIWLLSESTLMDSRQALITDLIAIYKAIGGDW